MTDNSQKNFLHFFSENEPVFSKYRHHEFQIHESQLNRDIFFHMLWVVAILSVGLIYFMPEFSKLMTFLFMISLLGYVFSKNGEKHHTKQLDLVAKVFQTKFKDHDKANELTQFLQEVQGVNEDLKKSTFHVQQGSSNPEHWLDLMKLHSLTHYHLQSYQNKSNNT